jgi:multidrug efflux pump subunit AcrA (membrane-fusion protein)
MSFIMFNQISKRFLLSISILFVSIIVSVALYYFAPSTPIKSEETQPVLIRTEKVKLQDYTPNILLHGQAVSARKVSLVSKVSTTVSAIKKEEGEQVTQGEVLIQLNNKDAERAFKKASYQVTEGNVSLEQGKSNLAHDRSALENEKKSYDLQNDQFKRTKKLYKSGSGIISQREYEREYAAFIQAEKQLHAKQTAVKLQHHNIQLLEARLSQLKLAQTAAEDVVSDCKVLAPFTGVITKLHVAKHEEVAVGQRLVDELPSGHTEVRVLMPNSALPLIQQTLAARKLIQAQAESINHSKTALQLKYLSAKINRGQLGREAIFNTIQPSKTVPMADGQFLTLLVRLPTVTNCYLVPLSAVYDESALSGPKTSFVYKITSKNRLKKVTVKTFGSVYNMRQMTAKLVKPVQQKDLSSGDLILSNRVPNAINGLLVKQAELQVSKENA